MPSRIVFVTLIVCGVIGASHASAQQAPAAPAEEPAAPQQGVTDTEVLIANSIAVSGAYAPVGVPFQMSALGP